jgi:hypothetical protein
MIAQVGILSFEEKITVVRFRGKKIVNGFGICQKIDVEGMNILCNPDNPLFTLVINQTGRYDETSDKKYEHNEPGK